MAHPSLITAQPPMHCHGPLQENFHTRQHVAIAGDNISIGIRDRNFDAGCIGHTVRAATDHVLFPDVVMVKLDFKV